MDLRFEAIGTFWQIDFYENIDQGFLDSLAKKIKARIEEFDKNYSRFRDDSLVSQIAQKPGTYKLPQDAKKLLDVYTFLNQATGGLFNPCIGNTLSDLGYDKNYSLKPKNVISSTQNWKEISYTSKTITTKKPVELDFGAAGKGYLVDIISNLIKKNGLTQFCVDASGDMIHQGKTPIVVGLEDPKNPQNILGTLKLQNRSLAGSSGSRRAWSNLHHIINPNNFSSPKDILATWVVANDCLVSDALATCLFLVSPEKLTGTYDFEYLILNSDYSVKNSANFPAKLYY